MNPLNNGFYVRQNIASCILSASKLFECLETRPHILFGKGVLPSRTPLKKDSIN